MYKYVLRRLLLAVPVLLLSSLIVFGLMRVMPGDALTALMGESGNVGEKELAKLRKDLGLDLPVPRAVPALALADGEPQPRRLHLHQRADPGRAEEGDSRHPRARGPGDGHRARHRRAHRRAVRHAAGQAARTTRAGWSRCPASPCPTSGSATLVITFAAIWFHWIPPIGYVSFWESPWRNLQQFLLPAAVLGYRLSAGDHADDPLDRARDLARGLRAHGLGQGARGPDRRLQARAEERADPGRHDRRRPARRRCWPGRWSSRRSSRCRGWAGSRWRRSSTATIRWCRPT